MHLQTYSCSQLSFMSSCCVGDVFDQHHLVHSDRWAAASAAAASRVVTEKTFTVGVEDRELGSCFFSSRYAFL